MDFKIFLKIRLFLALSLLCVVIGVQHEYYRSNGSQYLVSNQEEIESDGLNIADVLYCTGTDTIFSNPIMKRHSKSNRNRRSLLLECRSINYNVNNQVGHRSTCAFDWIANYERNRIPERIIEQVCVGCGQCGPNHHCTQLEVQHQVFFRDTLEFSRQIVRAGCVCMPREIGATAVRMMDLIWSRLKAKEIPAPYRRCFELFYVSKNSHDSKCKIVTRSCTVSTHALIISMYLIIINIILCLF